MDENSFQYEVLETSYLNFPYKVRGIRVSQMYFSNVIKFIWGSTDPLNLVE